MQTRMCLFASIICAVNKYTISTFTGGCAGGGTDANVYVRLTGEKGSSDNLKLIDFTKGANKICFAGGRYNYTNLA